MNWKRYLPIIGALIFIYLLVRLDLKSVLSEIGRVNVWYLLIALIFVFIFLFTQTIKWHAIAKKQKINVPFKKSFRINLITDFYGFVTPSKLGTIIRADYLKKYGNMGKGVSNFALDKVLDIISLFFMALVLSFIFKDTFAFLPLYTLLVIFLVILVFLFVFMDKRRSRFLLKGIYKNFVPRRLKKKVKLTFESFYEDMPKKRHLVLFFLLNLLNWIIAYIVFFFVGKAVGMNLPFIYFLAIPPIGTLAAMIPISISGIGTREAVLISLFELFGVGAVKVFSASIVFFVLTNLVPAIIGGILAFLKKN